MRATDAFADANPSAPPGVRPPLPPPSLLLPLPVSLLYTPPHASPEASHDRPDAEVTLHFANDFRGV